MKVTWLNESCSAALVERGLFRRERARVNRLTPAVWAFASGNRVPEFLSEELESLHMRAQYEKDWEPVVKPPTARLLKG